jgi:DNA-binding protein WhiA
LLFDADTDGDSKSVLSIGSLNVAEFAQKNLNSFFGKQTSPHPAVKNGQKGYDLALISYEATEFIGKIPEFSCAECVQHFLRGMVIASATFTDPSKGYYIEFKLSHGERVDSLSDYLAEIFDRRPITVKRPSGMGLVYKSSSVIEDILTSSGATQSYFTLINSKIEADIRNNANRATNCETRNIAKAVAASEKQIAAINALDAEGELEKLPTELRETAQLRKLYPDMPLSELAARHAPPISKSGINHRIKKLLDAAEKLKK